MKHFAILFFLFLNVHSYCQLQPVDVAELTIKIGGMGSTEMFYGFAEGDQILFSFEELNGKELKEVEIIELPNNSKFMDYKSTKIENKKIAVNQKAVYQFKFNNSAISGRICKVKIQRIPKSDSLINFNTNWKWLTLYDTSYVPYKQDSLIGYDTLRYNEVVKELLSTTQAEEQIFTKQETVHSKLNSAGNKSWLFFTLPANSYTTYEEKRVVSWAYWVGVGKEASDAWAQNVKTVANLAKSAAGFFTSPLGALAIGAVADLITPKQGSGHDVYYSVTNAIGKEYFMADLGYNVFDRGAGVAGYAKFTDSGLCQGTFYICLLNDNQTIPIDVNITVVAIVEIKKYGDKSYERMKITPKYITLNKRRMVVNSHQIRTNE